MVEQYADRTLPIYWSSLGKVLPETYFFHGVKAPVRRADPSSRGVLPTAVRRCVWSRILKNEEAMTRVGSQRHRKKKQPPVGQDLLIIKSSRSHSDTLHSDTSHSDTSHSDTLHSDTLHSDTLHSVGLIWTRARPVTEATNWQQTSHPDRHPCSRRNSNS